MFGKINFKDLFYAALTLLSCLGTYLAVPWFQAVFITGADAAQDVAPTQTITVAASPTFIPPADTPPGAMLAPGEAWVKDGVRLVLLHENRDLSEDGNCAYSLEFTIMNASDREVIVAVNHADFTLRDGAGVEWKGVGINSDHFCPKKGASQVLIDDILPGESWNNNGRNSWLVWFGSESPPPVNSNMYVEVANILTVHAYWRLSGN